MAQLLGSTLAGGSFSPFRKPRGKAGCARQYRPFLSRARSRASFAPGGSFEDDVGDILDHLRATPAIDPSSPVIVAGEPEFARRAERLKTGIPLNDAFLDEVRTVATSAGVDFILDSKVQ